MNKLVSLNDLAVRHLPGELPAGRSHFPHNNRGDLFTSGVWSVTDLNFGNMIDYSAVRIYRSYEYCDNSFKFIKGGVTNGSR